MWESRPSPPWRREPRRRRRAVPSPFPDLVLIEEAIGEGGGVEAGVGHLGVTARADDVFDVHAGEHLMSVDDFVLPVEGTLEELARGDVDIGADGMAGLPVDPKLDLGIRYLC